MLDSSSDSGGLTQGLGQGFLLILIAAGPQTDLVSLRVQLCAAPERQEKLDEGPCLKLSFAKESETATSLCP